MAISMFLGAIAYVTGKYVYSITSFWSAFLWLRLAGFTAIGVLLLPSIRKDAMTTFKLMKPKIKGLSRVSKVSRRIYLGTKDIRPVRQKHGDLILSTPLGILTGKDAKRKKVGGEALFKIW